MAQDRTPSTATLNEFADGENDERRPPRIRPRKDITLPEREKTVGKLVWDRERRHNAYLSSRTEEANLFRKYNAYPISTSVLGKLQYYEVERVLIMVRDDSDYGAGTVYEFEVDAYLPANSPTYEWDRGDHTDEQVCPDKDEDAYHIWTELGSDLYHTRNG